MLTSLPTDVFLLILSMLGVADYVHVVNTQRTLRVLSVEAREVGMFAEHVVLNGVSQHWNFVCMHCNVYDVSQSMLQFLLTTSVFTDRPILPSAFLWDVPMAMVLDAYNWWLSSGIMLPNVWNAFPDAHFPPLFAALCGEAWHALSLDPRMSHTCLHCIDRMAEQEVLDMYEM